jgi:hypothetical protein
MANTQQKSVEKLNSFLRGEISAVETYEQAIAKLDNAASRSELEQCRRSHQNRVDQLREQIRLLGGEPSRGSGAWGAFTKLVEGGATAFGEKAAIAALEQGEDQGLKMYRDDIDDLDPTSRQLVATGLLPAQEETHRALSTLKHSFH